MMLSSEENKAIEYPISDCCECAHAGVCRYLTLFSQLKENQSVPIDFDTVSCVAFLSEELVNKLIEEYGDVVDKSEDEVSRECGASGKPLPPAGKQPNPEDGDEPFPMMPREPKTREPKAKDASSQTGYTLMPIDAINQIIGNLIRDGGTPRRIFMRKSTLESFSQDDLRLSPEGRYQLNTKYGWFFVYFSKQIPQGEIHIPGDGGEKYHG